jgi:hypothetical protein
MQCGEGVCCYVYDGMRYDYGTWIDYNTFQAEHWSQVKNDDYLLKQLNDEQMSIMSKLKEGFK